MVSAVVACGVQVQSGGGGAGTGGGAACPAPTPGLCPPELNCVNGQKRNGEATCENGAWVCTEVTCSSGTGGSGGSGGCNGSLGTYCSGGQIATYCCPEGAPCAASAYCDLGGGACVDNPCDEVDGGAPCTAGSIQASQFDQTCNGDADCTGVYQGSLCSMCFCPNAAINQKALQAYQSDFTPGGPSTCFCPAFPAPVCTNGVCTVPALP
jgi:hypothetical protein